MAAHAKTPAPWPVTYRIYYNGATYWRYQFPGKPHIVIKQGGINQYNCG